MVDRIEQIEMPARFPIRWRWSMLVGLVITGVIMALTFSVLQIERNAWLENQSSQAILLVEQLGDNLKIPMLAGNKAEIDIIANGFLKNVPAVLGACLHYTHSEDRCYGTKAPAGMFAKPSREPGVARYPDDPLWFMKPITYAQTTIGMLGVQFSEKAWQEIVDRIVYRLVTISLFVIVLSVALVYWVAGRISKPLEAMADAAEAVAQGDYSVRLPVTGNDEITDAVQQFNDLVSELAHKEEMRGVFGRYLNPKLVEEVFDGAAQSENKRQEVTILFADMVGFTEFSESTTTEEVVEVLNKHFEVFHSIIDYYGGHVDKYIGDAVMAVFNHPNEDEDHTLHAAMAGVAMSMACSRLGILRKTGEPISFRVGINRGQGIVGSIGAAERQEYTVIGDAVNIASRMGGIGNGGEVILSRATYEKAGDHTALFDSVGECQIKGVKKPIECGKFVVRSDDSKRNIRHAVTLAFDMSLTSDLIEKIGAVDDI
ncbi:MAG: adenylate/guanylate cyclase domain-containing protein [Mariprofundaceae bacterium]